MFQDPASGEVFTYVTRAAYRYYDDAAGPDPLVFEPVLFPIAFEGAGAYGSQWTTENSVIVEGFIYPDPGLVLFWKPPCATCPTTFGAENVIRLEKATAAAGAVVYLARGTGEALQTSSRIRDLSRQAQSAGTGIPVVRESHFRKAVTLPSIPTDARFRVMLRVWATDIDPNTIAYVLAPGSSEVRGVPLQFSRTPSSPYAFASADLTPILPTLPHWREVDVLVVNYSTVPLWAMVSITNNDTQEVTIIAPH
jgi:hypothetical protein